MTELRPVNITKRALFNARIPEDYHDCDFVNYQGPTNALDVSIKYLKNLKSMKEKGVGLMYVGPVGTGKTTLAFIVMKYLVRARWVGFCTSLGEIVENIQKSWKQIEAETKESSFITKCREADFLFLDDLSKEHTGKTGFVETTLDNLIRYRAQHRTPTFLTTNLDRRGIQGTYGESIISLLEGKVIPIEVNSQDYRKTHQKNDIKVALTD